jgi:uncharacterized protein YbjQ (UPF0145 family)/ribosomal protein L37AE/L43A
VQEINEGSTVERRVGVAPEGFCTRQIRLAAGTMLSYRLGSAMIVQCPACGAELVGDGRFCGACGLALGSEAREASRPTCPSCGSGELELLETGSFRCVVEDRICGANEISGATTGSGAPPHGSHDTNAASDSSVGLAAAAPPTCPSCGSTAIELLSTGSYRCLNEDKVFGASEIADPAGAGFVDPAHNGSGALRPVLLSTTFAVPDHETIGYHGEVFGFTVRTRNVLSNFGASTKAMVGGELRGLTRLMRETRLEAIERVRDEARRLGANAIVGLRFDTSEFGDYATELVAYGTAVTVRPLTDQESEETDPTSSLGADSSA